MSDYAVNVVLFLHKRDKEQSLIYYVSKVMVDAETRYSKMEQMALALKKCCTKALPLFSSLLGNRAHKPTTQKYFA